MYNDAEPFVILGQRDAPALDPIAWYSGNSGVEYVGGIDCSDWAARQYPEADRCGTHPVGMKAPNPWGLYDVLGNVWEWVSDRYAADYGGPGDPAVAEPDPLGPSAPDALRAFRGGGLGSLTRHVRAPFRNRNAPAYRSHSVGLRPVRSAPCQPGDPRADDDVTCNGIDDDCDDEVDEDYVPRDTECGVGACASTGRTSCVAGRERDSCEAGEPADSDDTCDGIDDDCDGEIDQGPPCNGCPAGTVVPAGWLCVPTGEFVMGSPGAECPDGACLDPRCDLPAGCPGPEPGRFDGESQHRVRVTRPYFLKATEVTQVEWRTVAQAQGWPVVNPSYFVQCGDDCPVEMVNWYEAVAYCNALSRSAGLDECYDLDQDACQRMPGQDMECPDQDVTFAGPACEGYRLPTEAEWEYAARAGTFGAVYNEAEPFAIIGERNAPALDPISWYGGNSGVEYAGAHDCSGWPGRQHPNPAWCGTHAARGRLPNAWGLYGMLGNVWEWVSDRFASDYGGVGDPAVADRDPLGPNGEPGATRVQRGGSWSNYARYVRAPYRIGSEPGYRYDTLGLRPARRVP